MTDTFAGGTFDVGDRVRLQALVTDLAGVAADPDTVVCKVRDPAGTITTHNDAQSSVVGTWYKDIEIDQAGKWAFRFECTGAVTAAEEMIFVVEKSLF